MMNINKNSWHYKVFANTFSLFEDTIPRQSNLCQYFRRLMFAPFIYLLAMVAIVIVFAIVGPLSTLIGYYPVIHNAYGGDVFEKYPGLKVKGVEVYPWMVILLGLFLWLNVASFIYAWHVTFIIEGSIVGCIVALFFGVAFIPGLWHLTSEWLAARKQKICPLINFIEKP